MRFFNPTSNKKLPSNRSTFYRHNNNYQSKRIQASQVKKNQWQQILLHQPIPTVILKIYLLNISIHQIIPTQSYPSIVGIYYIPHTINKKTMTTYNQHQVSEIKHSHISTIHSQPTTPTVNVKTNHRKEKSSFHSLETNLPKIQLLLPSLI